MTRPERFRSARAFLLYGVISGALLAGTVYGWSKVGLDDESAVYMGLIWFLFIFTLMGLGGGIYLLVRALACGISRRARWSASNPPTNVRSTPANAWMFDCGSATGSHKTLKSVVRSFVESFTSYMNYYAGDLAVGHVVKAAWSSGATGFRFDLLTGAHDPSPLLVPEVSYAIAQYAARLPSLILNSNSSLRFVSRAELAVTVDPTIRRPSGCAGYYESPFTCQLRIIDDRDKEYCHRAEGWSGPRQQTPADSRTSWWKPRHPRG